MERGYELENCIRAHISCPFPPTVTSQSLMVTYGHVLDGNLISLHKQYSSDTSRHTYVDSIA